MELSRNTSNSYTNTLKTSNFLVCKREKLGYSCSINVPVSVPVPVPENSILNHARHTMKTKKTIQPPHSKDAEMMVLGSMLSSLNGLNIAAQSLLENDFYYKEHQTIFKALKSLYSQDKSVDILLASEELKRIKKLEETGGVAYLTSLSQYSGTSAYIEEYVDIIKNKAILRHIISASDIIRKNALEEPLDVSSCLDDAQKMLFQIGQSSSKKIGVELKDILLGIDAKTNMPFLKELEQRQELYLQKGPQENCVTGIATHFHDLDKLTNGFGNSHLIILAARPAMGKTALAVNIAENICFKNNVPIGIFSLEMSAEQLVHRIITSQSEVESEKIATGSLSPVEFQHVVAAVNNMSGHTMIIDDQPGLKITDLRARARRMKEQHNIGLLIVDYLQLLSGSGSQQAVENRQNEISEISRLLKNIARELDIPVLCIAQLSRKVEERAGHKPLMSDLRESGCLTGDTLIQDAKTGSLYTIKELASRKEQKPLLIHGVNDAYKVGQHTLVKAFYSGKKMVFELTTRSGRSIRASANHPFLKLEGWTRLDKLTVGDRIACPRNLTLSHPSSKLKREELILLAHLLGDGCILPKQPYHYTSADQDNIQVVQDAAYKLFNIQARIVKQKNWHHLYLTSPEKLSKNKVHPITTWFEKLDIQRVRSHEKQCPKILFECPESDIALFLHHLWATDGNISEKRIKNRKPSAAIYYASSSVTFAKQVQKLLLQCEIRSTIRTSRSAKGYRNMYHVVIQGVENQSLFLTKIGSYGQRGEIVPKLLKLLEQIKPHANYDVIPKEAWRTVINAAKNAQGLNWRNVCKLLGISYSGSFLRNGISRERMRSLCNILHDKTIHNLAHSDVLWDEIIAITQLQEEDVYDATIEGVHNFVANDIIVHNSIEQDADLILLLLRREYYDPNDRPGQAQLFVAKNRHGAVGDVLLTYRKELAQFANYAPLKVEAPSYNEPAYNQPAPVF